MWLFKLLGKIGYRRRYKASLIILLGTYLTELFDDATQKRIDTELNEHFKNDPEYPVNWKLWAPWYVISAYRAAAMQRLGIEPLIPELNWKRLFKPWRLSSMFRPWGKRNFDLRPVSLCSDFRLSGQALEDARVFLNSHGIPIPDRLPYNTDPSDVLIGKSASQQTKT